MQNTMRAHSVGQKRDVLVSPWRQRAHRLYSPGSWDGFQEWFMSLMSKWVPARAELVVAFDQPCNARRKWAAIPRAEMVSGMIYAPDTPQGAEMVFRNDLWAWWVNGYLRGQSWLLRLISPVMRRKWLQLSCVLPRELRWFSGMIYAPDEQG